MSRQPFHTRLIATLFAACLAAAVAPAAAQPAPPGLRALLEAQGGLRVDGRQLDRVTLLRIYQQRDFEPLWVTAPGREATLLRALGEAAEHGLDPAAFTVPATRRERRELLLTDAFLRYAAALAHGRVSAKQIEDDWAFPAPAFDALAALDQAAGGDPGAVLGRLAPS